MDKKHKIDFIRFLQDNLQQKQTDLARLIEQIRSGSSETKSSMGDKYETAREMQQQQINQYLSQLNVFTSQLNLLAKIKLEKTDVVCLGSFVDTSLGLFFIAIGLGKVKYQNKMFFVISKESPVAKQFLGKKTGDVFVQNGSQVIKAIY